MNPRNSHNNGFDSPTTVHLSPHRKQASPTSVINQWDDASVLTEIASNCRRAPCGGDGEASCEEEEEDRSFHHRQRCKEDQQIILHTPSLDCSTAGELLDVQEEKNYRNGARREASRSIHEEEESAFHSYAGRWNEVVDASRAAAEEESLDHANPQSISGNREIRAAKNETTANLDGKYADHSNCCTSQCCGVYDMRDLLAHSTKWFCRRLGVDKISDEAVPKKLSREEAAIRIQSKWRSCVDQKTRESVLVCCNEYCYEEEERTEAAVFLQSRWRGSVARRRYAAMIAGVITLQSRWRRRVAIKRYADALLALLTIQSFVRRKLWERHRLNDEEYERHRAATVCQSIIRRRIAHNRVRRKRWFHLRARRRVEAKLAVKCQCAVRRWIAVRRYRQLRDLSQLFTNEMQVARASDQVPTHCSEISAANNDYNPNPISDEDDWLTNCQRYNDQKRLHSQTVAQRNQVELFLDTTETADETLSQCSDKSDPNPTWDESSTGSAATAETPEVTRFPKDEEPPAYSRCGFSDEMHEMLLESGKKIYEWVGDPDYETAVDLLRLMERAERSGFCCGKRSGDDVDGSSCGWGCHR